MWHLSICDFALEPGGESTSGLGREGASDLREWDTFRWLRIAFGNELAVPAQAPVVNPFAKPQLFELPATGMTLAGRRANSWLVPKRNS